MPTTIRETLSQRVRALPSLQQFLADFPVITGVPLHYVTILGQRTLGAEVCMLCRFLQTHDAGAKYCTGFLQRLLEQAHEHSATAPCDAGLWECAVPLRSSGQTFGFFVFGHHRRRPADRPSLNRARHLLARVGVSLGDRQLEALLSDARDVSDAREAALLRLVETVAERLVLEITQHIVHPTPTMPPLVEQACRQVRAEYAQPFSLPDFAARLGVSAGHLSRVFHQNTGLRFVEYVARVRAEQAKAQIEDTNASLTEIAFACGFRSLSQFNRTMRAHFGCQPRELRKTALPLPKPQA